MLNTQSTSVDFDCVYVINTSLKNKPLLYIQVEENPKFNLENK